VCVAYSIGAAPTFLWDIDTKEVYEMRLGERQRLLARTTENWGSQRGSSCRILCEVRYQLSTATREQHSRMTSEATMLPPSWFENGEKIIMKTEVAAHTAPEAD